MAQDKNGWEIPDPTPVAMPTGFKRPETLAEQVRRLVRQTSAEIAAAGGAAETMEEAEDFDVEDDPPDPTTPYEEHFDPVLGRGVTDQEVASGQAENWIARARAAEARLAEVMAKVREAEAYAAAHPLPPKAAPAPTVSPAPVRAPGGSSPSSLPPTVGSLPPAEPRADGT